MSAPGQPGGPPGVRPGVVEPSLADLAQALGCVADADGVVPAGVAGRLRQDYGWGGRLVDVLEVMTENFETMGYLAGGQRADEVVTWLVPWADSPLSLEEIRLVVASGGWDPEPFAVIARAGLLEKLLRLPDGTPRRIRGELAGGWVSDELALAEDDEILRRVRQVIDDDAASPPAAAGPAGSS
jgi:hypothetical protein